jgi:hypothetical protein
MVAECRSMRCNKSYQGVTTRYNTRGHGSTNSSIFYTTPTGTQCRARSCLDDNMGINR